MIPTTLMVRAATSTEAVLVFRQSLSHVIENPGITVSPVAPFAPNYN